MSEKPKKRSSLKISNNNDKKLLNIKSKRHSVSWGKSNTFQFKQMKATFEETKDVEDIDKETELKRKKFDEIRRKSVKDEFSLVKEKLKKAIIEEEDEEDTNDENIKMGHEALNEDEDMYSNNSDSEGN